MINYSLNSPEEVGVFMPHSGTMVLIDRVLDYGPELIVTELDIGPRLPCYADDQVPAYIGIEVMAQSIAVWFGIRRGDPGTRPPIGLLLGTRHYKSELPFYSKGCILKTHSQRVLENEGLAVFNCEIEVINNHVIKKNVANANISVYSPP